jgi:beta-lactamase regulating signal transducer with metallopeptidase domain
MIAALLDHLWQSTLFAGAIVALMPLFRRQSAALRFALWFAASMKFLVPFAALAALGRALLGAVTPDVAAPLLSAIRPAAVSMHLAAPLMMPAPAHIPAAEVAAIVWAVGMVAITLLCLSRWLELRASLRTASTVASSAPVPVKTASSFLEPGLVGIFRPVILLPHGLSQQLTQGEMDAILAHELCHLRRRDNLLAAMHMLVEGLFWFHPLVWWIGSRLVEERERACDESVVGSGIRPLVYAEGILKICRFYVQSPLACASGVSGSDLEMRLGAIMARNPVMALHPAKGALLGLGGALVLMLPLAAGMLPPVSEVAARVASVLAAPQIILPAMPAPPLPKIAAPQIPRAASPIIAPSPHQIAPVHVDTDVGVIVNTPPSLAADTTAEPANTAEEHMVCRRPENLPGTHLPGPTVCLPQSTWDRWKRQGMVLTPDGRSVVGAYEKRRSIDAPGCPAPTMVGGATTGMGSLFSICY